MERGCGEAVWRGSVERRCGESVWRGGVERWCGEAVWRGGVEREREEYPDNIDIDTHWRTVWQSRWAFSLYKPETQVFSASYADAMEA